MCLCSKWGCSAHKIGFHGRPEGPAGQLEAGRSRRCRCHCKALPKAQQRSCKARYVCQSSMCSSPEDAEKCISVIVLCVYVRHAVDLKLVNMIYLDMSDWTVSGFDDFG